MVRHLPASIATAFLIFFWCLVTAYTPATVHWRDSGEFLLASLYLDITHPPGSPLFTQISNLFALLPLGPISWRINSFAALSLCLLVVSSYLVSYEITRGRVGATAASIFSLIAPFILLSAPTTLRSAAATEVYALHGAILLMLLWFMVHFFRSRDKRWLLSACLLGGLGIGNHVSLGVTLLAAATVMVLLVPLQELRSSIIPGIIAGVVGMSIFIYLPIRADSAIPLNTGAPNTPTRLVNQLTNYRDRALRPTTTSSVEDIDSAVSWFSKITQDAAMVTQEIGTITMVIALCGMILLLVVDRPIGLLLLSITATQGWFFSGWDPDPWVSVFALLGIGCTAALAAAVQRLARSPFMQPAIGSLIALIFFMRTSQTWNSADLAFIQSYDSPVQAAERLLAPLPPSTAIITEISWFAAKYLRDIEGFRPDLVLVYQPSIIFPEYFAPVQIARGEQKLTIDPSSPEPMTNLSRFISFAAHDRPLAFEPNMVINDHLRGVARCSFGDSFTLESGAYAESDLSACTQSIYDSLAPLIASSRAHTPFRADDQNYLEARLTNIADLAFRRGEASLAIDILEHGCSIPGQSSCSPTALNNLASYYIEKKRYQDAVTILSQALKRYPTSPAALRQNLAIAERGAS